jgi:hypothetical protein
MGKFTVKAESNELVLKNAKGDHVIIPAKNRTWVQKKLQEGCHDCIDKLVESLPIASEYAAEGTLIPTGPPVTPPVMAKPTYADSLALYENALALREFYNKNKQYAQDLSRSQPIATLPKRLDQSLAGMQNKENRNYRTNVIVDGKRQSTVVPVSEFNKPVVENPNQYYQREIENNVLNMNAPMALIDKRIPPDVVNFYKERIKQNPDLVTVATYNPETIRPKMRPAGDTTIISPAPAPILPPARKPEMTPEEKRRLIKSGAVTGRVSFGTSNNRPMNSPGAAGRGGYTNRLDGKGANATTIQRFLELFKRK